MRTFYRNLFKMRNVLFLRIISTLKRESPHFPNKPGNNKFQVMTFVSFIIDLTSIKIQHTVHDTSPFLLRHQHISTRKGNKSGLIK